MKELFKNIGDKLGLKVISNEDHFCNLKLTENVNITLYNDSYRKKLNVGLSFNDSCGLSHSNFYGERFESVSMSPDKSLDKIVSDIQKRVVDKSQVYVDSVNENIKKLLFHNDRKLQIAKDIEKIKSEIGDFWRYENDCKRDLSINEEYGYMKIETNRITAKTIIKIVKLLDEEIF